MCMLQEQANDRTAVRDKLRGQCQESGSELERCRAVVERYEGGNYPTLHDGEQQASSDAATMMVACTEPQAQPATVSLEMQRMQGRVAALQQQFSTLGSLGLWRLKGIKAHGSTVGLTVELPHPGDGGSCHTVEVAFNGEEVEATVVLAPADKTSAHNRYSSYGSSAAGHPVKDVAAYMGAFWDASGCGGVLQALKKAKLVASVSVGMR